MEPETTIYQRVLLVRQELNLSQKDFADKTGVSRRNLQNYELGNTENIPHGFLEKLARLGISPEWLIFGTGTMKSNKHEDQNGYHSITKNLRQQNEILEEYNELLKKENRLLKDKLIQTEISC